ncbi:MAG: hypothetical protein KatS3mg040_1767 [Candidatus Kapaibacterium sp.]|nr:MAG: hypothetical protein KatS3mg040_1767 [Candidatus Kapabacteria bacterium]
MNVYRSQSYEEAYRGGFVALRPAEALTLARLNYASTAQHWHFHSVHWVDSLQNDIAGTLRSSETTIP